MEQDLFPGEHSVPSNIPGFYSLLIISQAPSCPVPPSLSDSWGLAQDSPGISIFLQSPAVTASSLLHDCTRDLRPKAKKGEENVASDRFLFSRNAPAGLSLCPLGCCLDKGHQECTLDFHLRWNVSAAHQTKPLLDCSAAMSNRSC